MPCPYVILTHVLLTEVGDLTRTLNEIGVCYVPAA